MLTITNWGAYGPGGAGACLGLAAGAPAPNNVLHAYNLGGPNQPGVGEANPTLLPGGNVQPGSLPGSHDAGVNGTWEVALSEIWRDNEVANGNAAAMAVPVGAAGDPIEFTRGDPTILTVSHTSVCMACAQALLGLAWLRLRGARSLAHTRFRIVRVLSFVLSSTSAWLEPERFAWPSRRCWARTAD